MQDQHPEVPANARPKNSAPLVYPIEPPEPGGDLRQIADGLLWARIPMPIALNHINVYLLRDSDGWVLVDTGLHHDNSYAAWKKIADAPELGGLPFKALICTHYHYDHAGVARWLCGEYKIPLYMTRAEHNTMRNSYHAFPAQMSASFAGFFGGAGFDADTLELITAALRKDPFMTDAQDQYIRLRGGDVLRIGERSWRVLIGGGHSPEHACLYSIDDPEQPLLLAGDQLISRISSNVPVTHFEPEANPLQVWLDSLSMLEELDAKTWVMPAHQGVFTGLHLRTQELRAHHLMQLKAVEEILQAQGESTAIDVMKAIFPKLRNPIDQLLAVGESVAHLNWLLHQGRISRRFDAGRKVQLYSAQKPDEKRPLFGTLHLKSTASA